jgi:hypothetical protein
VGGLAGSAARGVMIYCGLQTALTALFMSVMLCRMEKLGMPYLYRKAGVLFLGLSPFVALYAIGMLKDSVYSLLFIMYYLVYVVIIREEATSGRMLWLILLSVLLALTKKTGVYFVILCNIALLFVPGVRRRWAEWLASWTLPAVLLLVLLPKVVFPMFAIFPGGNAGGLNIGKVRAGAQLQDLGNALLGYRSFEKRGFSIVALFDKYPSQSAYTGELPLMDISQLETYLAQHPADIAILTLPAADAQEMARRLYDCGIRGFWNFAPTDLQLPRDAAWVNVHLDESLEMLSYHLENGD